MWIPTSLSWSFSEDVTDAYQMAKKLRHQASHDELTGLLNRREFEQQVSDAIAESAADGSNHALLYMDLDQFKLINDSCGHAAGDELLRQLASVLQEHIRRADIIARLGGDEFGVLMKQCSVTDAMRLADSLRGAIESYRFHWNGKLLIVGASIGVVPLERGGNTLAQVLSAADNACFGAKDAGRNRVHLYSEADEEIAQRNREMRVAVSLGEAIELNRFRLYCQPITALDKNAGEAEHWEILLRLEDMEGELVLPTSFLPAAERYGMIPRIDRWVITEILKLLEENRETLMPGTVFCVNLSGRSVSEPTFMQFLTDALIDCPFPASTICFEITETAAISNLVRTRRGRKTSQGDRLPLRIGRLRQWIVLVRVSQIPSGGLREDRRTIHSGYYSGSNQCRHGPINQRYRTDDGPQDRSGIRRGRCDVSHAASHRCDIRTGISAGETAPYRRLARSQLTAENAVTKA